MISVSKKMRSLRNLQLNGRDLPWDDMAKHLGCKIEWETCKDLD